jgi:hypothetical protein
MEDHEDIVSGAVEYTWDQTEGHVVVPLAPRPIEMQRTAGVGKRLARLGDGDRWALLNRTTRLQRSKDLKSPDAEAAEILRTAGYKVCAQQVPNSDVIYARTFGTWPLPLDRTPFPAIAKEIISA